MRGSFEIRFIHLLFLVAVICIVALWYFGRSRPISIVQDSSNQIETCSDCFGSGKAKCPVCGGFGTLDAEKTCPKCKGSGKHKLELSKSEYQNIPCMTCRGSGRVDARSKCSRCLGTGKITCSACGGKGTRLSTKTVQHIEMGFSLWENILKFLGFPLDPNPCPQMNSDRTYPIVSEYIKQKTAFESCRIIEWGEFSRNGDFWVMTGTVEFAVDGTTQPVRRVVFAVKNRKMIGSKIIK